MPKTTRKPSNADPDRLVRQPDGGYRTSDERFTVEAANGSWFLADQEMADDFGQPRVSGPFATLKAAGAAIPAARSAPVSIRKPIRPSKHAAKPTPGPPPKPVTWLDRLSKDDRRRANRLVKALQDEGLADAEMTAQAVIEGRSPRGLAQKIVRARLDRLLTEADADGRGRKLLEDALALLSRERGRIGQDLPGWALVEVDPDGSVTDHRIELD